MIDKIREELKHKVLSALIDPKAPWYGSDVVEWIDDYIICAEKRIQELESKLSQVVERHTRVD